MMIATEREHNASEDPQKSEEDFLSISNALKKSKKAVKNRTKELQLLYQELLFQNEEKEKRAS
jgi:hypothetical protein